jgi:hypothetical protein
MEMQSGWSELVVARKSKVRWSLEIFGFRTKIKNMSSVFRRWLILFNLR